VTLLYFAWLRQKIGKSEETIILPAGVASVADLIAHLKKLGPGYADAFSDENRIRVAVNQKHSRLDGTVTAQDEIAFFPPVTGG